MKNKRYGNKNAMKHGYCMRGNKHPLCGVLNGMRRRCLNPEYHSYSYYGGRGIDICKEWAEDTGVFVKWALENGYKPGLHIDRIDNDKGYYPDNCHFVTQAENNKNQRKRKDNASGYRGVSFKERNNKWQIQVCSKYIGLCSNPIDAAVIRDSYVINNNLGLPLNFSQPIILIKDKAWIEKTERELF